MSNVHGEELRISPLHSLSKDSFAVPRPRKKPSAAKETVGDRIRRLRLARGLTQIQLGRRVGVSQRVVTYYEVEGVSPAPDLLLKLAKALDVGTDELLGQKIRGPYETETPVTISVWRRIKKLQILPPNDRKTVFKMIDTLAERVGKQKAS
jgi:transcriptional regulator with XRE-family HTH domain